MSAKHQLDPKTKKVITHYGPASFFTVYLKRYNGRKQIVSMGTGDDLKTILKAYHELKIYENDRKYLFHRLVNEPVTAETKVLIENGQGKEPVKEKMVGRKKITYQAGELPAIKNIPKTLLTALSDFIKKGHTINGTQMNKTRLVGILLADFLEKKPDEQTQIMALKDLSLEKHKLLSGGVTEERITTVNFLNEVEGDELL